MVTGVQVIERNKAYREERQMGNRYGPEVCRPRGAKVSKWKSD